jgi:hypothetical protein
MFRPLPESNICMFFMQNERGKFKHSMEYFTLRSIIITTLFRNYCYLWYLNNILRTFWCFSHRYLPFKMPSKRSLIPYYKIFHKNVKRRYPAMLRVLKGKLGTRRLVNTRTMANYSCLDKNSGGQKLSSTIQ